MVDHFCGRCFEFLLEWREKCEGFSTLCKIDQGILLRAVSTLSGSPLTTLLLQSEERVLGKNTKDYSLSKETVDRQLPKVFYIKI